MSGAQAPSCFLASAKDPDGVVRPRWVEAQSLREAAARLAAEGATDAVFHEDEVAATVRALGQAEGASSGARALPRPPAQKALADRSASVGPAPRALAFLHRNLFALALVAFLSALLSGAGWTFVLVLGGGLLLFAFVGGVVRPKVEYARVLEALYDGDGKRAARRLDALERLLTSLKVRHALGSVELAALRAQGLQLQGRTDEALSLLAPAALPKVPPWLLSCRRLPVYLLADDAPRALAEARAAAELNPGVPTLQVDLAIQLAMLEQPREAREALGALDGLPRVELVERVRPLVEAFILLSEADPAGARRVLARVPPSLGPMPMLTPFERMRESAHVLTAAQLGEREDASRRWRALAPRLRACGQRSLCQRIERALAR